jgi:hypothetical protein
MGRYDAIKNPFVYRMSEWANRKTNDPIQRIAKSIPCHVTKIEKDFVHVAFETADSIMTLPVMKIPQSMSPFGRDPTQVGAKGYAVPGHYYLGGVTGDAGGATDFAPRGNLTTLSFQPTSHVQNPPRDYDQNTHMGGPNGWKVGAYQKQQSQQGQQSGTGQQGGGAPGPQLLRGSFTFRQNQALRRRPVVSPMAATPSNGTNGGQQGGQQQQNQDQTQLAFDKQGLVNIQSKDDKHKITVDQPGSKITVQVPTNGKAYLGGDGQQGTYAPVMTAKGPSINCHARVG